MIRTVAARLLIPGLVSALISCQDRGAADAGRRADDLLEALREAAGIPGLSVAVAVGEEIVYSGASGLANIETGAAVSADTRYRIGSVTKLLTATAAAGLIEDGVIGPADRVGTYVPDLPEAYRDVTIERLAGHTAGVRHYAGAEANEVNSREYADLEEAVERFIHDPLLAAPGERYRYSSYGYVLLGAALENAAGKRFTDLIRDRVLAPAGLSETVPETAAEGAGATRFYTRSKEGGLSIAERENFSHKRPAAGWLSTAADLARFGGALVSGKIVAPDALPLLLTSRRTSDGAETGCGFGFRIGADARGRKIVHHGGETPGARAFLLIYPEVRLTVALAANVYRAPLFEGEAETLAGYFLGDYARRRGVVPAGEYSFAVSTRDKTVQGGFSLRDGKGELNDFPGGAVTVVDIVLDGDRTRLIGVSASGVVNIWLEPAGDGYAGRWGYNKPEHDFKMSAVR
jgi:CubicO group peptidase (beta-lactamase class C family)